MNKVIKLHGCSGSGKTTVARALMLSANQVNEITPEDLPDGKPNSSKKPEAYLALLPEYDVPVAVLGSYKNNCGGMDSYSSDSQHIIKLIDFYRSQEVHVLFEGLLLSTYFGAVGKYMEGLGDSAIFAFMNTPILTCLERVTHRRDVNQSKNKFNPQNTIDKFNTIEHLKNKCKANGRRVVDIEFDKDPVPQLKKLYLDAS